MPNTLFLDGKTGAGGTACAVFQYVNATPAQVGDPFGLYFGAETDSAPRNGVVQFQGELYAFARDGIYKKNDPTSMTGGWTIAITFASIVQAGAAFSGLHPIEVGGVLNLVGTFKSNDSGNSWRWVKFDGSNWTQAPGFTALLGDTKAIDSIVYRGVLHTLQFVGGIGAMTFDPATNSFALVSGLTGANGSASMCVWQDRLFLISKRITTQWALYEFAGGAWAVVADIDVPTINTGVTAAKTSLFTDGAYMFAARHHYAATGAADNGWRITRFDAALNQVPRTADLPAALRSPNDGGTYAASGAVLLTTRLFAIYDAETTPGTVTIYLAWAPNSTAGTNYTLYLWGGSGAIMTPIDNGGNVSHNPPTGWPQGGMRIWTAGELDVKILSRAAVLGGEQISFVAYGGGTGRKFKLFYALLGEPNLLEATLAAPVTGGAATLNTGLNQVEGVAADGVTVYTVIWNIGANSVAPGTILDRFPQISV